MDESVNDWYYDKLVNRAILGLIISIASLIFVLGMAAGYILGGGWP